MAHRQLLRDRPLRQRRPRRAMARSPEPRKHHAGCRRPTALHDRAQRTRCDARRGIRAARRSAVPPSGPAASPARTSPSPESAAASPGSPASPIAFLDLVERHRPPPSSSRTYRDSSPVMAGETWRRSSVDGRNSGMASAYRMLDAQLLRSAPAPTTGLHRRSAKR